jgi:hypothetical protein
MIQDFNQENNPLLSRQQMPSAPIATPTHVEDEGSSADLDPTMVRRLFD